MRTRWIRPACVLLCAGVQPLWADEVFRDGYEDPADNRWNVTIIARGLCDGSSGRRVSVQLNGGQELSISSDGPFAFDEQIANDAAFTLAVTAQPATGAQCSLAQTEGTATGPVKVTLDCAPAESLWDQLCWGLDSWE